MAKFSSTEPISKEVTTRHDRPLSPQYTPPSTPTAISSAAHQLLQEIQRIYSTLTTLPSLAPSPEVNTLLTHLIDLCTRPYSSAFASHFLSLPGTDTLSLSLRPLCATAEGELERHWAGRILSSVCTQTASTSGQNSQAQNILSIFPYHQNYIDLSRLECSLLEAFLPPSKNATSSSGTGSGSTPSNILFIGSGPLPLTSFCMLDRYPDAIIHNIDRDVSALTVSRSLSDALGYGQRMTFSCEDVGASESNRDAHTGVKKFPVVFLAALVGMDTATKMGILASLARTLAPGTLVVARSARGVRGLVYPVLELSDALQSIGFEILAVVHPWTEVVNSVVVLRVRE